MRILIVKLSSIGDVVMTTPAARAIRRHIPGASIYWVVEPKSAGVLEANPDVDEVIVWSRESVKSFFELAKKLRSYKFDAAIDFQGLARSGLVTAASGAKRRIGFTDSREGSKLAYNELVSCHVISSTGKCYNHMIRCYLELLKPLGITCDDLDDQMRVAVTPQERESASNILAGLGLSAGDKIAALCPATTRDNKHWTEEGWAALAELLWDQMGLRSVFMGAKSNIPMIESIMSQSKAPSVNVAGKTTLKEASAVLDLSETVIAVDTGLLHVGVAIGKPTVGVFGPTPHWRTHAHRPNFVVVRNEVECAPCRNNVTCQRFECITDVTPEDVMSGIRVAIEGTKSGQAMSGTVDS